METASRRIAGIKSHLVVENTSAVRTCPYSGKTGTGPCPYASSGSCSCSSCAQSKQNGANKFTNSEPLRVVVTGAAGNIAYSLLFMIANGNMFGPNKPVILHLLDIPPMAQALKGVEMELLDGAFPLLRGIVPTTDIKTAFSDVDVACLVGAFPRAKGMERKDLLKKNAAIFKEHGNGINSYAKKDVKVVVVGNPANTNCLIAATCAPNIPRENFSALTRLDHNRAVASLSQKLNVPVTDISNVVIWGNHSSTQYPDVSYARINSQMISNNARSAVNDDAWLQKDFIGTVQQRGAKIIEARKLSSAASAAHAVVCHVRDWTLGTKKGEFVSMAIVSDGSYGVPKDIVYSFPVTCSGGKWTIVQGLPITDFSKKQMQITAEELLDEKKDAFEFLDEKSS